MRTRSVVMILVCVLGAAGALAQTWTVHEWYGSSGYTPDPIYKTIVITAPNTYMFYVTADTSPSSALDALNGITVDFPENVSGDVTVSIVRDPATAPDPLHPWGCTELGALSLQNGGATASTVPEMWVQHDAATLPAGITFGSLTGPCTIGGNVVHDVTLDILDSDFDCNSLGNFYVNSPSRYANGVIFVHAAYDAEMLVAGSVAEVRLSRGIGATGTVYLDGDVAESLTVLGDTDGTLTVTGAAPYSEFDRINNYVELGSTGAGDFVQVSNVVGNLVIHQLIGTGIVIDEVESGATLTVDEHDAQLLQVTGSMAGTLKVPELAGGIELTDLSGAISVFDCAGIIAAAEMSGRIEIDRSVAPISAIFIGDQYAPADLSGTLHVGGDFAGYLWISGDLRRAQQATSGGQIIIDGGFRDGADIRIEGAIATSGQEFIAVDYDGYNPDDTWDSAAIIVGPYPPTYYFGNTPEAHIFSTTPCKGDLDNSGSVGFSDIDPFIEALGCGSSGDPVACFEAAYDGQWFGRGGSSVWHGDMDCNGHVGFTDIDYFVARISNHCCSPECYNVQCDQQLMGGGEMQMAMSGPVGDPAALGSAIADAFNNGDAPAGQDFWESVYYANGEQ